MNILSPRGHGYVDYLAVIGFFAAPSVFEFEGTPATVSYALSAIHLVLTLATDFPLGLVRAIPFPLHGLIEFAVAILLLAMPWILGFSGEERARLFYVGAGASLFAVFLITDYRKSARA